MSTADRTTATIRRIEAILDASGILKEDLIARATLVNQVLWLIEDERRDEREAVTSERNA